ncbi:uncharacterized protein PpBr36_09151 [Pyricularia pennisetigena]|uniref:uncharacterized protein n=1 Tax=Pyricularia pennisetigena TaxID=1578925 RepID=UPI00114E2D5C|nr:uncharacterized protein PpBr36_09151 [Pyricularia pennisetigena]TLS22013.1 hypothetical protein PpBr36_09151 [Pyricularia pennisetigena]
MGSGARDSSATAALRPDLQNNYNASQIQYASVYPSSSLAKSTSIASASDTSSQIWSDSLSQTSDDSSASSATSQSDSCESQCGRRLPRDSGAAVAEIHAQSRISSWARAQNQQHQLLHVDVPVSAELRQNPRRSASGTTSRIGCPPTLVRQSDRKVNFVDSLVDSSTQIVEAIWPTSSVICRNESNNTVLPLRTFIQETLRRSRTSYSTLQVALYYLILVKPHVPDRDFTMEQPDDCHASRALQCGRRMFLAALILASKYLQDRNYSARAWSKISGLATHEINQNEIAFLLAVNWNLHITNEVYNRWTDCVMKFTPSQPPSPGGAAQRLFERQCDEFRYLVLNLTPDLANLEALAPSSPSKTQELASSPRSIYSNWSSDRSPSFDRASPEATVTPTTPTHYTAPMVMEPTPATVYTPGRLAPALGLLPTPRLTPQSSGFSTPAVSAAGHLLNKGSSMGLAMAQATSATAAQAPWSVQTPWPTAVTSSPHSYFTARRSSLANTISTASSPESMISDLSRTSRSSSISSASSLASAPSTKLDVQARCRYAKLCNERSSLRPIIATVPEDYEENCITSSPEPYCYPVGKDACVETPLARREREIDDAAARALQDLHNHQSTVQRPAPAPRAGSKRGRTASMDITQDQVRELLRAAPVSASSGWTDNLVRPRFGSTISEPLLSRAALRGDGRKRVCCSTEAAQQFTINPLHPAVGGMGGPGMWDGILN